MRDGEALLVDDEAPEHDSLEGAKDEAMLSLAELALDAMGKRGADDRMSMEVRDGRGPVLQVSCTFEVERLSPNQ